MDSFVDCRLLFVYGTLRRGFSRHHLLEELETSFVGKGSVRADLFDLGDFPGARASLQVDARVAGEVYQIRNPARTFEVLEKVEGFEPQAPAASLFRRDTTAATLEDGRQVIAWIYWVNRTTGPARHIVSGDYERS